MLDTALAVPSSLSHNVPAVIETAKTSLTNLATLDAKRRDLQRFLTFHHQLCGHDRPQAWFVSVMEAFLTDL